MNILEDVEKIAAEGISGGSVVGIIAITLVGAVVLIAVCSGCLLGIKKLFHKCFRKQKDSEEK